MEYTTTNANDGFVVFSEAYYKNGWIATIDEVETSIFETDYMLRGLKVPKGTHTIQFTFDPPVVKKGGTIMLVSSIILLLFMIGGIYMNFKNRDQYTAIEEA